MAVDPRTQYIVQQLAHERKEQVRKVLKFFETRGTTANDDISSSLSACEMAIATSDGVVADAKRAGLPNEALERTFGEYMVSLLRSDAQDEYGHDELKPVG